ncbi:gas vesicle protein [Allonocardiopsis opalescens]|uniref:Gas vesicle protein GvpA/GvpJ/GvpM family n=1 Tax=Allonocardiopsis opalescens TaxID=1144618 RepID=A0A2T0QEP5_9ACTN|nr:gas vesicle protein [Allonocardiopsis opalescens]PRY02360.1 gas vesicle protein GvpA/GvpJ/GvpM family [Allonocardiopsis opalescens]
MTQPAPWQGGARTVRSGGGSSSANLADILERVLDKGVVIAGDIKINLLDIELLTVKLRLLVASVDKAKEMGIDWWEHDPALSSAAQGRERDELAEENERLRERLALLEERRGGELEAGPADDDETEAGGGQQRTGAGRSRAGRGGGGR